MKRIISNKGLPIYQIYTKKQREDSGITLISIEGTNSSQHKSIISKIESVAVLGVSATFVCSIHIDQKPKNNGITTTENELIDLNFRILTLDFEDVWLWNKTIRMFPESRKLIFDSLFNIAENSK